MRILAVPKRECLRLCNCQRLWEYECLGLRRKIRSNGSIVLGGILERFTCQRIPQLFPDAVMLLHFKQNLLVTRWTHSNSSIAVVLCRCANQGRSANIDVLHDLFRGDIWFCDSCLKRVQVHDNEVNRINFMLAKLFDMLRVVQDCKKAGVNGGMEGLHAAIENFGKSGDVRNRCYINSCISKCLCCSARGNDFHTIHLKGFREFRDPAFVGNAEKRPSNGKQCFMRMRSEEHTSELQSRLHLVC